MSDPRFQTVRIQWTAVYVGSDGNETLLRAHLPYEPLASLGVFRLKLGTDVIEAEGRDGRRLTFRPRKKAKPDTKAPQEAEITAKGDK